MKEARTGASQAKEPAENVLTLEVVDSGGFTARCSSCPEWHFESNDYEEVLKASLRHWLDAHGKDLSGSWVCGCGDHHELPAWECPDCGDWIPRERREEIIR